MTTIPVVMLSTIVSMNCVLLRSSSYAWLKEECACSRFPFIAWRSAVIRLKEETSVPNSSSDR